MAEIVEIDQIVVDQWDACDLWDPWDECSPETLLVPYVPSKSNSQAIAHKIRRGFTTVEVIGTFVLLGVLFSITVPMFVIIARERQSTQQRQFALQHVTNLVEGALTRQWSELEPGELPIPGADADLKAILPGLERTLVVKPLEGSPESRQISASIRWRNHSGQFVVPIQMSGWVYPTRESP